MPFATSLDSLAHDAEARLPAASAGRRAGWPPPPAASTSSANTPTTTTASSCRWPSTAMWSSPPTDRRRTSPGSTAWPSTKGRPSRSRLRSRPAPCRGALRPGRRCRLPGRGPGLRPVRGRRRLRRAPGERPVQQRGARGGRRHALRGDDRQAFERRWRRPCSARRRSTTSPAFPAASWTNAAPSWGVRGPCSCWTARRHGAVDAAGRPGGRRPHRQQQRPPRLDRRRLRGPPPPVRGGRPRPRGRLAARRDARTAGTGARPPRRHPLPPGASRRHRDRAHGRGGRRPPPRRLAGRRWR